MATIHRGAELGPKPPARAATLLSEEQCHPQEGTRGSIWDEQAGRDSRHLSTSRSSGQRHVKATRQHESLEDHRQPHSVLPTCPGGGWKHERALSGAGTERGPPTTGHCGPHAATGASLPTLSISLALFSHSPTSRPLVSSPWLSSTLAWAPAGSGEASSRPGMTDMLFPGAASHLTQRDLDQRAACCAHSRGLEAAGVTFPSPV